MHHYSAFHLRNATPYTQRPYQIDKTFDCSSSHEAKENIFQFHIIHQQKFSLAPVKFQLQKNEIPSSVDQEIANIPSTRSFTISYFTVFFVKAGRKIDSPEQSEWIPFTARNAGFMAFSETPFAARRGFDGFSKEGGVDGTYLMRGVFLLDMQFQCEVY